MSDGPRTELSVILPVYNEGEAVEPVLRALSAGVRTPHELVVVYDFDGDTTVPVVARLTGDIPNLRGLRNDLGRGVLNAMKAGIAATNSPYVLISMADGSDEPQVVDPMVALARDGADVVSASRYMRGGHQVGGPPLKRLMSRDGRPHPPLVRRGPDPRPDQQLQALLAAVPRQRHHREHRRLRAGPRADGQGDDRWPPRRRGTHDVARSDGRTKQLQASQVAAALPALVSNSVRGQGSSDQSSPATKALARPTQVWSHPGVENWIQVDRRRPASEQAEVVVDGPDEMTARWRRRCRACAAALPEFGPPAPIERDPSMSGSSGLRASSRGTPIHSKPASISSAATPSPTSCSPARHRATSNAFEFNM